MNDQDARHSMISVKTFSFLKLWLCIAILIGGSSLFMYLNDYSHKGCSPMKIALHALDETYSCEVRVKEKDRYAVSLEYTVGSNTAEAHMAVREAAGGPVYKGEKGKKQWTKQSHPVRVSVSISAVDNNDVSELASGIVESVVHAHGADSFLAELIRHELEPGLYKITVKNLKIAPGLQNINTNIVFENAYEGN